MEPGRNLIGDGHAAMVEKRCLCAFHAHGVSGGLWRLQAASGGLLVLVLVFWGSPGVGALGLSWGLPRGRFGSLGSPGACGGVIV